MFGYLKPYKNELKLKQINEYKKAYCTVCYGLRKNIGLFSSLSLNYESVFLYVFLESLSNHSEKLNQIKFSCPINPFKKVKSSVIDQLLEYVSYINYLLVLLKLIDNYRDTKKIIYKFVFNLFSKNKRYQKLQQKYIDIDAKIRLLYDELYKLETNNSQDFDKCSATMGEVLFEIVDYYFKLQNIECEKAKIFARHLGMYVYLIDAYDDYEKDLKKQTYNPLYALKDLHNYCTDSNANIRSNTSVLIYAEVILRMMIKNMYELLEEIHFLNNIDIIDNIIRYSTIYEIMKIKQKRQKNEKSHSFS
ncbi:MAG: DUF5685 family protein [Acutalibacteraceae bacterium]